MRVITIGTRGSLLALAQTRSIVEQLKEHWPEVEFKTRTLKLGQPAADLEASLTARQVDVVVRSLRDLSPELNPALKMAAVTRRVEPREVFVGRTAKKLETLPAGSVVAVGSLSRQGQLLAYRPELRAQLIVGDLDAQLTALGSGDYDALVTSGAALLQLELPNRIDHYIDPSVMLPTVGQGSLVLEVRTGDEYAEELAYSLNHRPSADRIRAERSFLIALGLTADAPVAALAAVDEDGYLRLEGSVFYPDGSEVIRGEIEGEAAEAVELGQELAQDLLEAGGRQILASSRGSQGIGQ